MEEKLKVLSRQLTREEIDFRVGSIIEWTQKGEKKVGATILAYKDARVDMKVLDEAFSPIGWQTVYQRDSKGVLQCGIGVYNEQTKEWVWKYSNGTESNTESEKGEYSDAFKRAGFMWGIGRHLYDMPEIFVTLNDKEYFVGQDGKARGSTKLRPNKWAWVIEDGVPVRAMDSTGIRWELK